MHRRCLVVVRNDSRADPGYGSLQLPANVATLVIVFRQHKEPHHSAAIADQTMVRNAHYVLSTAENAMTNPHYERVGGESGVRRLVERFYALMDSLPEAQDIRRLHPQDLSESTEKLFLFLSGWFGGPPLYVQKYGHPKLRARHMPFPVGTAERDQWMLCMRRAMEDVGLPEELRSELEQAFFRTADFMRNKDA